MNVIQEKMFDFIYTMSLRDSILRNAYKFPKKELFNNNHAKNLLRNYLNKVLEGQPFCFNDIERAIETSFLNFLGNNNFTFGNSQKLVNMTFKYAYLFCYKNEKLKIYFTNCHCPMDNIMINIAIEELEKIDCRTLSIQDKQTLQKITFRGYKTKLRQAWSNITKENTNQYELFQQIINFLAKLKNVTPLEYDYLMWNQQEEF